MDKNDLYGKENILKTIERSLPSMSLSEKGALTEIVSGLINEIMDTERNIYLREQPEKRNGFYDRTLQTSMGKLSLDVPRTREGTFRPQILPEKYTRYDSSFEELLKSLLINGDSKSEIISKLKEQGLNYSPQAFDEIYERLRIKIKDFKTSVLDENYFFIYIDAYEAKVKDNKDSKIKPCNIYTVIGIDFNANKKIISFYPVFGKENKDTWKTVFQDLVARGLKRVLLFICDDFAGISDAIKTFFPDTDIQKCFVHLQRNVFRNTSKEDCKDIINKLKQIKNTDSFEKAVNIFNDDIINVYNKKYPDYIKHLTSRVDEYVRFLEYPEPVRKHIYTTNPVESVNSGFEKIRYRKSGYFQSIESLELAFFLFIDRMNLKWELNSVPLIKNNIYELNQIFRFKFYS